MEGTLTTVGTWAIGLLLIGAGMFLVGRAILDVRAAIGKETKEWWKAVIGVFVGIVGGFMTIAGAQRILSWFQGAGSELPF